MEDIYNRPSTCDLSQLCMQVSFYLLTTLTTLSVYKRYLQLSFCPSSAFRSLSTCLLLSLSMTGIYSCPSTSPSTCKSPSTYLHALYPLCKWQVSTAVLLPVPAPAGLLLPHYSLYPEYPLCQWQVSTAVLPLSGSPSTCSPLSIPLSFLWQLSFRQFHSVPASVQYCTVTLLPA